MTRLSIASVLAAAVLLVSGCSTLSGSKRDKIAEAHYKLGISFLNSNQYQQAFVEFQKSIEADPKHRDSHYALGHIYFQQGKLDDAAKEFETTLKLDRNYSEAHNYLGKVYEDQGDLTKAKEQFRLALENQQYATPQFAHYNLGNVLMKENDSESALKEFEEAIRIEPSFLPAYLAKGQALDRQDRRSEAIDAFKHYVDMVPNDPQGFFGLGVAYYREGSNEAAKKAFAKVVELAPEGDLAKESKDYLEHLR